MIVAAGSDHAGHDLKQALSTYLSETLGAQIVDVGTYEKTSCDYPVFATKVAEAVVRGEAQFGLLVCGTGIGMSIAANKVAGATAALCSDPYSARMAREHNDAAILCMGARVVGEGLAEEIARVFFTTGPITDVDKYQRRRDMVAALDETRRAVP